MRRVTCNASPISKIASTAATATAIVVARDRLWLRCLASAASNAACTERKPSIRVFARKAAATDWEGPPRRSVVIAASVAACHALARVAWSVSNRAKLEF
jgi:hypothetical protein